MSTDVVDLDGLKYRWRPARTDILGKPPQQIRVALGAVANGHERGWFVSDDVIYMGSTARGTEVAYRVTGWDAEALKLILTLEPAE